MSLRRLVVVLLLALGVLQPPAASAQGGAEQCRIADDLPSACRLFLAEGSPRSGSPLLYQFASTVLPTERDAERFMEGASEGLAGEIGGIEVRLSTDFGEEQVAVAGTMSESGASVNVGFVAFRTDARVAIWGAGGMDASPFSLLEDVIEKVQARPEPEDNDFDRVLSLLPTIEDLPPGFELAVEQFSPDLAPMATAVAEEETPSYSDLEQ